MKANKFAFMLYQNKTPKTTILLIYTLLEWALIALLLMNGVFYYLIDRFANFFGLEPPCIFCSRVDHMFGPKKSYKDLMCDAHTKDVSKYGFCLNHRNLAMASEMSEDCASSRPLEINVLNWMKRIEAGEKDLSCSFCNVMLESKLYTPFLAIGNEFDVVKEAKDRYMDDEKEEFVEVDVQKAREFEVNDESLIQMENCVLSYEERLVPVELVDNATLINEDKGNEDNIGKDKEKLVPKERTNSLEETISNNIIVDEDGGNVGYNVKQTNTNLNIYSVKEEEAKLALLPTNQPFKPQTSEHKEEWEIEPLNGSTASEIDGNEMTTMEHFKAALSALYTELEEERSASAVAANQTMAMITRLQEEKAAVQMEVLQYRREMDEQYEFDQETLQLLNELIFKRESENRELENMLELYRKMVQMEDKKINGSGSETSFASSSNEESDDLSFEETCEREETVFIDNTCAIDVSLDYFEEESLFILGQLKALEDQLFIVHDDEFKCTYYELYLGENGHGSDSNGKLHHHQSSMVLPLFGATINTKIENEVISSYKQANKPPETQSKSVFDDKRRLEIAEEVDNIYERLQALEEDREFLKHCIKSLKKGEKGTDILQKVLQHLCDLRCIEHRVRNAKNELSSLST